jgi:hypothetical protein
MSRFVLNPKHLRAAAGAVGLVASYGAAHHLLSPPPVEAKAKAGPGSENHHSILIVGGGAAGLSVASMLSRKLGGKGADVAVIEPAEYHYYQPGWTLVGGGILNAEETRRPMSAVMNKVLAPAASPAPCPAHDLTLSAADAESELRVSEALVGCLPVQPSCTRPRVGAPADSGVRCADSGLEL